MLSITLTTSCQYSSKLLFLLNIVTNFALSKQIWMLYDQLLLEFPYEYKSYRPALQHRLPNFCLRMEILRREKNNFGRRVFIFDLLMQNKSLFSGKIITYLKIDRMSLNVLAVWSKSKKIEMQIIYVGRKVQV